MDTIALWTEVGGPKSFKVFKELRPDRVIIDYDGALVFAGYNDTAKCWELYAGSVSPEDEAVMKQALADYGTLDKTVTTVTKD